MEERGAQWLVIAGKIKQGESDVGPGARHSFFELAHQHIKNRLLINVQNNKLEVQSRTARTILLYRVYLALLSLSVNDRPKEMHTNAMWRTRVYKTHTYIYTYVKVHDTHVRHLETTHIHTRILVFSPLLPDVEQ